MGDHFWQDKLAQRSSVTVVGRESVGRDLIELVAEIDGIEVIAF